MYTITNETVSHAIDYILEHINEELSVEDVAAHCHFSKYYFSRMFKAETGESIYAFMKRQKLEQSAFRLKVEPNRTVTDNLGIAHLIIAGFFGSGIRPIRSIFAETVIRQPYNIRFFTIHLVKWRALRSVIKRLQ